MYTITTCSSFIVMLTNLNTFKIHLIKVPIENATIFCEVRFILAVPQYKTTSRDLERLTGRALRGIEFDSASDSWVFDLIKATTSTTTQKGKVKSTDCFHQNTYQFLTGSENKLWSNYCRSPTTSQIYYIVVVYNYKFFRYSFLEKFTNTFRKFVLFL